MSAATAPAEKPFELFELLAACLMGLGAVGAALAGFQGGLWGGNMTDAYNDAGATTTKAASTYSDELANYLQDALSSMRAKELVWVANESDNEDLRARNHGMASWMLLSQLSEPGYAALQLPAQTRKAYEDGADQVFTQAQLDKALALDLDESPDYEAALFAGSAGQFKQAEALTATARAANTMGDRFALSALIMTLGLFFAGLSLVFKTRIRWGFLATGTLVLGGGLGYMLTLPFVALPPV